MVVSDKVLVGRQVITGTGADAATRPSLAFGDKDTGLYEDSDDHLGITLGGVSRFFFSGSEFTQADGTKYITSAVVGANAIGNEELSGQIRWNKLADDVQGRVLYVNSASQVSGLAVGTSGQVLMTHGASENPIWTDAAAAPNFQRRGNFPYVHSGVLSGSSSWQEVGYLIIGAGDLDRGISILVRGGCVAAAISGSAALRIRFVANSVSNSFDVSRSAAVTSAFHAFIKQRHDKDGGGKADKTTWISSTYQADASHSVVFQDADHGVDYHLEQASELDRKSV